MRSPSLTMSSYVIVWVPCNFSRVAQLIRDSAGFSLPWARPARQHRGLRRRWCRGSDAAAKHADISAVPGRWAQLPPEAAASSWELHSPPCPCMALVKLHVHKISMSWICQYMSATKKRNPIKLMDIESSNVYRHVHVSYVYIYI